MKPSNPHCHPHDRFHPFKPRASASRHCMGQHILTTLGHMLDRGMSKQLRSAVWFSGPGM